MHHHYITAFKGFLIGATMMIPGVSGGSMAMILGIYDRLITSISSFRKNPLKNFIFLTVFSVSAVIGMFLFSAPLTWLLRHFPMETVYFFLGAIFGGIPMIEKKSNIRKLAPDVLFYMLTGLACVLIFISIPEGLFASFSQNPSTLRMTLPLVGVIAATALILPGISVSHFLLILGIYEPLLHAVKALDLTFLVPLGFGIIVGILMFSKLLERLLEKHPTQTYLIILGFILGSAAQIFPGIPSGLSALSCTLLMTIGFVFVYFLSRKEN